MARHRRGCSSVTVHLTVYDEAATDEQFAEKEYEVDCDVSAGSPEIRWGDNACPADPGEVDVTDIRDGLGSLGFDAFISFLAEHQDEIDELAIDAAQDANEPDPDYERDRARDDDYDRRMGR